jgi:hypothetical protein
LLIHVFNKIAVSGNDGLDPGAKPSAGLHHDVPVEVPHQLLVLLGQVLGIVASLTFSLFTPHTKKSIGLQSGELGGLTSFAHTSFS